MPPRRFGQTPHHSFGAGAECRSVCTEAGMYAIRARRKSISETRQSNYLTCSKRLGFGEVSYGSLFSTPKGHFELASRDDSSMARFPFIGCSLDLPLYVNVYVHTYIIVVAWPSESAPWRSPQSGYETSMVLCTWFVVDCLLEKCCADTQGLRRHLLQPMEPQLRSVYMEMSKGKR